MDTTLLLIGLGSLLLLAGAALWALLRLRALQPEQSRRRAALIGRAHQAGQDFSRLARSLPPDPGEPYATPLARSGQALRSGWQQAREIEARLRQGWTEPLSQPPRRLVWLGPLVIELAQRLLGWQRLAWCSMRLGQAEARLAHAERQREQIAGLAGLEQAALQTLSTQVRALQGELSAHPLAEALGAQRDQLAAIEASLAEGMAQLGMGPTPPTPAQVAAVYPARAKAADQLASIRAALKTQQTAYEKQHLRLERLLQKLAAFESALAVEESQRAAVRLHEQAAGLRGRLSALQDSLRRGQIDAVETGLSEGAAHLKVLDEGLKKLAALRQRLVEAQRQNGAALAGLREWLRQYPAPFMMDLSNAQAQALRSRLQEQAQAATSEDLAELERLSQVDLSQMRQQQVAFERSLAAYDRLAPQLAPEAVAGLQQRGSHLAARLKLRHSVYQEKARLPLLEERLQQLADAWTRIQNANPDRQSDLITLGAALGQVENLWKRVEADEQRAFETLEQIRLQQERAVGLLEDEAFGELPALAQLAAKEWALPAAECVRSHAGLLARAARGDVDFHAVGEEAALLQKEAARLVKEYRLRLARAQSEMARLVAANSACADRLQALVQHAQLDFEETAGGQLDALRRWLGQAQVSAGGGVERQGELVEQGETLRQHSEALCRAVEADAAAADQDRAWTEDMLSTAEEYLGGAQQQLGPNTFNGELAAARNLLNTARRKMGVLAAPRRKGSLADYQAALADVRQMILSARSHVDTLVNDPS